MLRPLSRRLRTLWDDARYGARKLHNQLALNPAQCVQPRIRYAYNNIVVASHVKTLNASLASFVFKLSHLIGRINRMVTIAMGFS